MLLYKTPREGCQPAKKHQKLGRERKIRTLKGSNNLTRRLKAGGTAIKQEPVMHERINQLIDENAELKAENDRLKKQFEAADSRNIELHSLIQRAEAALSRDDYAKGYRAAEILAGRY